MLPRIIAIALLPVTAITITATAIALPVQVNAISPPPIERGSGRQTAYTPPSDIGGPTKGTGGTGTRNR